MLQSWNEGPARQAVLEFLRTVTEDGPGRVVPADRVATFDNDGTLWCEQPLPPQFDFVLRRWATMAAADPSKRYEQPYRAAIERDADWLHDYEHHVPELLQGMAEAFTGTTPAEFEEIVGRFFTEVSHPRFGVPYDQVFYQPMRELLDLLASLEFRVFIASGGAYDAKAERALATAARDGWTVVSMRDDWATLFPTAPVEAAAVGTAAT